ncbi:MAG: copper amine oxidase [Chloroflexota bacterium]
MSIKTIRLLLFLALLLLVNGLILFWPTPSLAQGGNCSAAYRIDVTLESGARWRLCWTELFNEGITFRDVRFTPPNGTERLVLFKANIAQVHVPYDPGNPRFHEVSDFGMGGFHAEDLTTGDCPDGTLLQNNGIDVLCQTIRSYGHAYNFYELEDNGTELNLFSIAHQAEYNYIMSWTFRDDGSIEPGIGYTGHLQYYSTDPTYGWPIDAAGNYATAHAHNAWWRLDFDVGGSTNDQVEEIEFSEPADLTNRPISTTTYLTEVARPHQAQTFRAWRIVDPLITNSDGHPVSYEILTSSSHLFRGPAEEPWTTNDFYLTQNKSCERFISHNPTTAGCADNASAFVNGQTVTDAVVWYGVAFHHLPRDEDEEHMPTHWVSFRLLTRDWSATNPHPTPTPIP